MSPIRTASTILLVSAAAAFLAACSPAEEKQAEAVIRPVKVVEVRAADTERRLTFSGSVKARTEMNMGFRIAGKVIERRVDIGDRVKPGDVLFSLDPADIALNIRRAEADLAANDEQLKTATIALDRARALLASETVSKSALEARELAFRQAEAARNASAAALEQAKNQLAYATLTADRAGVVTAVQTDVGQVVGAGSVVAVIAADGDRDVEIAVPETDIAAFRPGQTVKARFWADQEMTLEASVRDVAASADPRSRTFAVKVRLPEESRVLIGMTATIEADVKARESGFDLPLAALGEKDGKPVVWVVSADTATVHARPVTVSGYTDSGVRIAGGIKAGDLVVAAGTQFMTDEQKVRLPADLTGSIKTSDNQG